MNALDDISLRIEGNVIYVTGTSVEYAVYQEFGTSSISARPAMRTAASSVERRIGDVAGGSESVDEMVKKVALEIQREWVQNIEDMDIIDTGNYHDSIKTQRVS